jgi:hypothetical protein
MKRLGLPSFVAVLLLTLTGCMAVKPLPVLTGDVCARCRRTIVDPELAGEIINARLYATKYRTPVCMATYLIEHPTEAVRSVFVTDYQTRKLIRVESAYFVKTEIDALTHEIDFAAFKSSAEAVAFGKPTGVTPVYWDAVIKFAEKRAAN